ncbi:MAG: DUF1343 domain-containing protein [Clostridia bacterium]|nr:DUF1343 domain-containing protein [Clostridia bacterium]
MEKGVLSGVDRLETVASVLRQGRVGLMTNATGISRDFRSTIEILHQQFDLTALFAVEHGIRGNIQAGEAIGVYQDEATGLNVWPVYGGNHRLTPEMLEQFDIFCFDIQDVGARFYTYLYALSFAMEECAKAGKPVVVLDRINPLGGELIQGTVLDPAFASYVGMYPLPTRYGLTIGEYARWVKKHLRLDSLELHIAPLAGWRRGMMPWEAALPWVAPSPNCPSFHSAFAYIGSCIFEGTNVSEGRGTTLPFEYIGAPWIDGDRLARRMGEKETTGIHFRPAWFTPTFSKHAGQLCAGVQMHVLNPESADPVAAALMLLDGIRELYPEKLEWVSWTTESYTIDKLLGTDQYRRGTMDAARFLDRFAEGRERFRRQREPFLLYE